MQTPLPLPSRAPRVSAPESPVWCDPPGAPANRVRRCLPWGFPATTGRLAGCCNSDVGGGDKESCWGTVVRPRGEPGPSPWFCLSRCFWWRGYVSAPEQGLQPAACQRNLGVPQPFVCVFCTSPKLGPEWEVGETVSHVWSLAGLPSCLPLPAVPLLAHVLKGPACALRPPWSSVPMPGPGWRPHAGLVEPLPLSARHPPPRSEWRHLSTRPSSVTASAAGLPAPPAPVLTRECLLAHDVLQGAL